MKKLFHLLLTDFEAKKSNFEMFIKLKFGSLACCCCSC
jgi:hypothetical protein